MVKLLIPLAVKVVARVGPATPSVQSNHVDGAAFALASRSGRKATRTAASFVIRLHHDPIPRRRSLKEQRSSLNFVAATEPKKRHHTRNCIPGGQSRITRPVRKPLAFAAPPA